MKTILISSLSILTVLFIGCEDTWYQDVDPLIDVAEDRELKDRDDLPFLINGVKVRLGTTHDNVSMLSDLLSDQLEFTSNVQNATYPSYRNIDGMGSADQYDGGSGFVDNNMSGYAYEDLGQLRKYADLLIETVSALDVSKATDDDREAFYTGYLYGGLARHMYATYYGLEPGGDGGSPIDGGPMIYSADMYAEARTKFTSAISYATDEQQRILNSLIARTYLYEGDYANAATYADGGMISSDLPLQSEYSAMATNEYYSESGVGRPQNVVAIRFLNYIASDPLEVERLSLLKLDSLAQLTGTQRYIQTKYDESGDPINIISWQENQLMLAELSLRGESVSVSALDAVNAVRSVHNLSALESIDLDIIYIERDKELFCTGNRLPDQRRWESWHTTTNTDTDHEAIIYGTWNYLPISRSEKNSNPNL